MSILVLVIAVSIAIFYLWSKRRTQHLIAYEQAADRFYKSIKPLMEDADTPDELLDMIGFLNGQIVERSGARGVIYALLCSSSKVRQAEGVKAIRKSLGEFFEKRPELEKPFVEATAYALVAVILNGSGVAGIVARLFLIRIILSARSAAPEFAENVYVHSGHKSNLGNGLAAAA